MQFNMSEKEFLLILGFTFLQNRFLDKASIIFDALKLLDNNDLTTLKCLLYIRILEKNYDQALQQFKLLQEKELNSKDSIWLSYIKSILDVKLNKLEE